MEEEKSEKEKMIAGKPFKAFDLELYKERAAARVMVEDFNRLRSANSPERKALIIKLFGKTSKNFLIESPFTCDYGYQISIGKNFYANTNLTILDAAPVKIGNNVLIGPNVGIYTVNHPIHFKDRNLQLEIAKPIEIGNNVWIGGHIVINSGVTIGDNSIIGSGSVVTKSIPSNVVAAGNPCKVIRKITEEDRLV